MEYTHIIKKVKYSKKTAIFPISNCLIRPANLEEKYKSHAKYELYSDNVIDILQNYEKDNYIKK